MAGLVSHFPQLIWLSQYKAGIFIGSGVMIALAGYFQYRSRFEPCPIDPAQAAACTTSRKWSQIILVVSACLWLVGGFFAFLAPRLMAV